MIVAIRYASCDGLGGVLLRLSGMDSTEYASGYSWWGFRTLHRGMTADDVLRRIGEPLERFGMTEAPHYDAGWKYRANNPNAEGWDYSRSRSDSHYRMRIVVMRSGRIVDIVAKVYID